jgi:hypothetical protein
LQYIKLEVSPWEPATVGKAKALDISIQFNGDERILSGSALADQTAKCEV